MDKNIQTTICSPHLATPTFPPALNPLAFSTITPKASLVAPSIAPSYTCLSSTKLFIFADTKVDSNTLGIEFMTLPPIFTAQVFFPFTLYSSLYIFSSSISALIAIVMAALATSLPVIFIRYYTFLYFKLVYHNYLLKYYFLNAFFYLNI